MLNKKKSAYILALLMSFSLILGGISFPLFTGGLFEVLADELDDEDDVEDDDEEDIEEEDTEDEDDDASSDDEEDGDDENSDSFSYSETVAGYKISIRANVLSLRVLQ